MKFFISDTHFCHEMAAYHRKCVNADDMNELLIYAWNETVHSRKDEVYIVGDFCFGNRAKAVDILNKLNGRKYLIKGNHDHSIPRDHFEWIKDRYKLKYTSPEGNKYKFILDHYPLGSWEGMHKGVYHLHGHCHGNYMYTRGRMLDVGVDNIGFRPISIDEVLIKLKNKTNPVVDHHKPKDK